MKRLDALWGLALVLVLLLGYGLIPTPSVREPLDTYSAGAGGKKGFFLLAESLLIQVWRSSGALIPDDPDADTLVMLGPSRYPDRAQLETLHDWVSEGRALVFAARWQDPAVDLGPFGIQIVPRQTPGVAGDEETKDLVTDLVEGPIEWQSEGEVVATGEGETIVQLSHRGSPQVVWRAVGDGAVVVVASDYIFTNRSLTVPGHGLLAFRILETASPLGPVYFDEEMNRAGAPRVVGALLEPPFRLVTLQLLVVTLLFGWMASRRFGPVHAQNTATRRSLVEHAEALGNLHFKVGSGSKLLASYVEFFRTRIGFRHAMAGGRLERDPRVSRIPTADEPRIDQVLMAVHDPGLSRGRFAELVTFVARLRARDR